MVTPEHWLGSCLLTHADPAQPPQRHAVAMLAAGPADFAARLQKALAAGALRLSRIEECAPAARHLAVAGPADPLAALVLAVTPAQPILFSEAIDRPSQAAAVPASLGQRLNELQPEAAHLFAVLDGAQFDNLPHALLLGGFNSRSLYLDRGDNDPEQLVTAPQLLWLDETAGPTSRRPFAKVIEALLKLTEGGPGAVFWLCRAGGDRLYRHLRGLNMVELPASALSQADHAGADTAFAPALFRHADANALAQTLPCFDTHEAARFFGPAERIIAAPAPEWQGGAPLLDLSSPTVAGRSRALGLMRLSSATMARVEALRTTQLRRQMVADLGEGDFAREAQVAAAFARALEHGMEEPQDIRSFIDLDLAWGAGFETDVAAGDVRYELAMTDRAPRARIHYARLACEALWMRSEP